MDYPKVHIIILTWNNWEVTVACLESVIRLAYPDFEIVVVDNGSDDGTPDRIRENYPDVSLIENSRNLGFAAGCNVGLRYALQNESDYVFLLNNDTVVPPDLIDVLIAEAEALPGLGILAPMLRYGDNPEQLWFTGSRRHPLTLESVDFGPLGRRCSFRQLLCAKSGFLMKLSSCTTRIWTSAYACRRRTTISTTRRQPV